MEGLSGLSENLVKMILNNKLNAAGDDLVESDLLTKIEAAKGVKMDLDNRTHKPAEDAYLKTKFLDKLTLINSENILSIEAPAPAPGGD